jgi:probable rRNA maturation factor
MRVAINVISDRPVNSRLLRKVCLKVMKAEKVRNDAILSLSAITEYDMAQLNRKYLDVESPTDVMAFPMGENSREGFLLGDVLVCPEIIEKRKEKYDVEAGRELEFVIAHGVLHLLGYGDDDEEGSMKMDRRQREILSLPRATK